VDIANGAGTEPAVTSPIPFTEKAGIEIVQYTGVDLLELQMADVGDYMQPHIAGVAVVAGWSQCRFDRRHPCVDKGSDTAVVGSDVYAALEVGEDFGQRFLHRAFCLESSPSCLLAASVGGGGVDDQFTVIEIVESNPNAELGGDVRDLTGCLNTFSGWLGRAAV